jgi:sortase A
MAGPAPHTSKGNTMSLILPLLRSVLGRRTAIALAGLTLVAVGGGFTSAGAMVYAKALLAQALMQRAFAEEQRTGHPVRPWPWADSVADAQIAVPRLGIRRMVMASDTGQALAFGPGHVPHTAQAGDPGLAVYAGHRDTHFAFLGRLHVGDRIEFTRANGRRYAFAVTGSQVVRNDGLALDPASGTPELALATCWPLDGLARGPMRYVVRARLLSASHSLPPSVQGRTGVRIAAAAGGQ